MAIDLILKASSIITMDPANPRAEAVAVDSATGAIAVVGTLAQCQQAAPEVKTTDLGETVLMPGFIDPHSHPVLTGVCTQEPAYWIARSQGYATYADVTAFWKKLDATLPADQPVFCWGLERPGQGAPELSNKDLDEFFPTRAAVIMDISGHEAYFNSATIALNDWADGKPPADPEAARYGRNDDGTSNGRAYEMAAIVPAIGKVLAKVVTDPLMSSATWVRQLAEVGITTSSEHSYSTSLLKLYEAITSVTNAPIRVGLYHATTDPTYAEEFESAVSPERLWKAGFKMWADGTPVNGTVAISFPYLDSPTTRNAEIPLHPVPEEMLNYRRAQFDAQLDTVATSGLQVAVHAHGDVAADFVLDGYAAALSRHGLLGTDHRWRLEHWTLSRADQLQRGVALGVSTPLAAYQFVYQGDIYDGKLFASDIGGQCVAAGDAIRAGATVSFHSDAPVSPAFPLLHVQCMTTRRTMRGELVGPNQAVSLDDALRAITINAAYHLRREHDLGSIEVGKLADFVELSADPYAVPVESLTDNVKVLGTWTSGRKVDLAAFMSEIKEIDPKQHQHVVHHAVQSKCC